MESTISSKFGRGVEKAKYATDVQYIGEYSTREAASDAFSKAMSGVAPEAVLAEVRTHARSALNYIIFELLWCVAITLCHG